MGPHSPSLFAPDFEQSAVSHAITIQRPLQYHRANIWKGFEAYRVNGTPADCVAMGLYHWGGPDLVLSGINLGSNLGSDIWHSGTVAAAKQGVLSGVQAVAFSLVINGAEPVYENQKPYISEVIRIRVRCAPEEGKPRSSKLSGLYRRFSWYNFSVSFICFSILNRRCAMLEQLNSPKQCSARRLGRAD